MLTQKERIESLRRSIKQKRELLGVDSDILNLKSLKKYGELSEIKYPKSVSANVLYGVGNVEKVFDDVQYKNVYGINKLRYVFDKMIDVISKHINSELSCMTDDKNLNEVVTIVNEYLKNKSFYSDFLVSIPDDKPNTEFAKHLISDKSQIESKYLLLLNSRYEFKNKLYVSVGDSLKSKCLGSWRGIGQYNGQKVTIINLGELIAKGIIINEVSHYLNNSENLAKIQDELDKLLTLGKKNIYDLFSSREAVDFVEDNGGILPIVMEVVITLSMEDMIKKSFEISQYEDRLKDISSNYAKTYITKKNIPKKILNFMEDNKFLNMFGFVEADEECELEKLDKLSNELVELSKEIYLPIVKNNSLRFRKLGKLRASGVYYPGFNTLAIDLDGVSSFVHEMFHMIDFELDILSLNSKFEPLLNEYRRLMDEYVDSFGKDGEMYNAWYKSKSKYNRSYYRSNEEAFARMGELYITDVLNINSSFAKIDYNSNIQKVVYPKDENLLHSIKDYYDELFLSIKDNFERVSFEE